MLNWFGYLNGFLIWYLAILSVYFVREKLWWPSIIFIECSMLTHHPMAIKIFLQCFNGESSLDGQFLWLFTIWDCIFINPVREWKEIMIWNCCRVHSLTPTKCLNYWFTEVHYISYVMIYKLCKRSFFLAILLINVNIQYVITRILNGQCRIVHHSTSIHI